MAAGLSEAELAERCRMALNIVKKTEGGKQYPAFPSFFKWVEACKTTLVELFMEPGEKYKGHPDEELHIRVQRILDSEGRRFFIASIAGTENELGLKWPPDKPDESHHEAAAKAPQVRKPK